LWQKNRKQRIEVLSSQADRLKKFSVFQRGQDVPGAVRQILFAAGPILPTAGNTGNAGGLSAGLNIQSPAQRFDINERP